MKEIIKKYMTAEYIKRTVVMLISVALMGVGVKFLDITNAGPDPYSALNLGVSGLLHMSFGNYQLLSNAVLFVIVLLQNRKLFGLGTIGNMVIVGYAADFTGWLLEREGFTTEGMPIALRILIMLFALILFLIAAALYMNCGLGTSPFDAFAFLTHQKIEKWTKKKIPFRFIRMGYDATFTLLAFLVGGGAGLITVLMVLLLGPSVDAVSEVVKRTGIFEQKVKNTDK